MNPFSLLKREKKEDFLVLDIGTEAVKTLILEKHKDKIIISAVAKEYFDSFGLFDSKNFEVEIIKKTISKTIQDLETKRLPKNVFFGLPANILKVKILLQSLKRKNPKALIDKKEAESVCQEVLKEAQKKVSQLILDESGILSKDLHFISLKILEIKIDGYQVPTLHGYSGENLVFRVLTISLPKDYFKDIEGIARTLHLKNFTISHPAQSLPLAHLPKSENSIFLDVGGKTTQIVLIKDGKLERIESFEGGGEAFSQIISQDLGIRERDGRELKERYSNKLLSIEAKNKIREILAKPQREWYENLKAQIKEINPTGLFPPTLFLFGGGSLLPEIQEILEEGGGLGPRFTNQPEIKFIYPKDCYLPPTPKEGKSSTLILNNPQYTLSFLIFYARKIF